MSINKLFFYENHPLVFQALLKKRQAFSPKFPLFVDDFIFETINIKQNYNAYLLSNELKPIDEISEAQKDLNKDKNWQALFLFGYGYYNHKVILSFPILKKLIERHKNSINLVMFST